MNAHTKEMLGKRAFEGSKTLSALHLKAAEKGQIKTIEDALLMSTHIDAASPVDGRTALHAASAGGAAEMVRYLIEGGANVNARTKQQQTPLHLAGSVEAAQALLEGGADPKLKDYASGESIPRMKGRMASFCLERSGHLASHWDQGISFFAADRMWLQPPGWVHKMVSRHDIPAVWVAFSPSGLHSSQDGAISACVRRQLPLRPC